MATNFDPSAILGQATAGFMKLPLLQKILFPLILVGSVVGIIFVSKWANSPDYSVLYSDLSPADAAVVVEKLKAQKIKYELRADGGTIAVAPPEVVHELRMSLAADGVPKGGTIGFELLDQTSNLGATVFTERLKFLRALQGELERTIGSLDSISSVRVHITQPEKTVFARQATQPTASVMLKIRPGAELDKKQVKGIANLVAGSVEGLKTENVSIVDVFGNLLTVGNDEASQGIEGEANRIQFQREIEKGYIQRIEQMLQKVLGPGKVVARVTADLDFTSNEREEESYDPTGQVVRSERSVSEGAGGAAQRGGVPGVVSNLQADPNILQNKDSSDNANRRENVKNYEVSRAVVKTSSPRGRLSRLSVAVLVDGNYDVVGDGPEAKKSFKPLDSEVISRIESIVKGAVGFDSSRGDVITVENIPFFELGDEAVADLKAKANYDIINVALLRGIPILAVLLFFMIVVRPLVKFLVTPTEAEVDLARLLPTGLKELESELESEREQRDGVVVSTGGALGSQSSAVMSADGVVDLEKLEELIAENSRMVKDNPQQAALLIRYWLNEGRL